MSANCKKGNTPLGTPGNGTVTGVTLGPQDIVACNFYNLPQRTFVVHKDFVPNSGASVTVSLSCASGTSSPASQSITEASAGTFTVTGYLGNPNCTATESPIPIRLRLDGHLRGHVDGRHVHDHEHAAVSGTFTINKDFVPNSGASVSVSVTCTSGTPSPASGSVTEVAPLNVTVTGFNAGATCTATESPVPGGYTANQTDCANKALVDGGNVACTITNTLNAGTFIVNKDFVPNSGASVNVSITCTSGTPSPASGSASEATPFTTQCQRLQRRADLHGD